MEDLQRYYLHFLDKLNVQRIQFFLFCILAHTKRYSAVTYEIQTDNI